jgi:hypothetical protein
VRGELLLPWENNDSENEQSERREMCEVVRSREKKEIGMGRGMEMVSSGGRGAVGNASHHCRLLRLLIIHSVWVQRVRK